ncbi:MAG: hypothetical protein C0458_05825 [Methylobacterium sp.]|nr:hypothetical protein [Methylobacterium sp.]
MITRSRYVKDDPGRAGHLLNTSNNRRVVEHRDLDRGCPGDLRQFLAFSSALTAVHPRAKITLAHFKISPSRPLTRKQLLRTIARIKRENGISRGHPMRLIEHDKGDRPPHFHLLFSAVHPETGRVLSSTDNYARDELVSRLLEIAFGEAITPGPRIQRNAADLRGRGDVHEAQILEGYEPVRNRDRDNDADRQQAARTKLPPAEFRRRLAAAAASAGPSSSFPRALSQGGFGIALGDRRDVLMVVHLKTGAAYSLKSSLKKMGPSAPEVGADDLALLRAQARPLAEILRHGLVASHRRAEAQVDREIRRGLFEAAIDGEYDQAFSEARRKRAQAQRRNDEMSLEARRAAIRAADREAFRLRQRRIDRAFRAAHILQSRRLRKAAFMLAASGALLAGAGFPLAIGAGFAATAIMTSRAAALRAEARQLITMRRNKAAASASLVRTAVTAPRPVTFDFNAVPREQRVLVGIALRHLQQGFETELTRAIGRALGTRLLVGLRNFLAMASDTQKKVVLSWAKDTPANAFAAAVALRRAGEPSAAEGLEAQARRSKGRGAGRGGRT